MYNFTISRTISTYALAPTINSTTAGTIHSIVLTFRYLLEFGDYNMH